MKRYCDLLQARIGGLGLVLKSIGIATYNCVFQNWARFATSGFGCGS